MANKSYANPIAGLQSQLQDMGDGTFEQRIAAVSVSATGQAQDALPPGRAAATASVPTVLSNEDFARLGSVAFGGSNAAVTTVASSATSVVLKAANTARTGVIIANSSTAILYVLLGAGTASTTNFTFVIPAAGTVPSDRTISGFTGAIQGVWASANGSALVTEIA